MKRVLPTVMIALGAGALIVWFGPSSDYSVHFLNGLDVALTLELDGDEALELIPGKRQVHSLSEGLHTLEIRGPDGAPLATDDIYVSRGSNVYNPFAAAPLYTLVHSYAPRHSVAPLSRTPTVALSRFVARQDVDALFTEPPSSIQVKQNERKTRLQLDVAPGNWRTTFEMLLQENKPAAARDLLDRVLLVQPGDPSALTTRALLVEGDLGLGAALEDTLRMLETNPHAADLYYLLGHQASRAGRLWETGARIRPLLAKHPDPALREALEASFAPTTESVERLLRLAPPADPVVRWMVASQLFRAGRYQEFLTLLGSPNEDGLHDFEMREAALIATGRTDEAKRALALNAALLGSEPYGIELHARLLLRTGSTKERALTQPLARTEASRRRAIGDWLEARFGGPVDARRWNALPAVERESFSLSAVAGASPEEAWKLASRASKAVLESLDTTTALLLAAEFHRASDAITSRRLFDTLVELPLSFEEMAASVERGPTAELGLRLKPWERAALWFVHSRRLDGLGRPGDADEAREAAARDDILPGIVTSAMARWRQVAPAKRASEKPKGRRADRAP